MRRKIDVVLGALISLMGFLFAYDSKNLFALLYSIFVICVGIFVMVYISKEDTKEVKDEE